MLWTPYPDPEDSKKQQSTPQPATFQVAGFSSHSSIKPGQTIADPNLPGTLAPDSFTPEEPDLCPAPFGDPKKPATLKWRTLSLNSQSLDSKRGFDSRWREVQQRSNALIINALQHVITCHKIFCSDGVPPCGKLAAVNLGNFSRGLRGVVAKRLSSHEVDPNVSRGHEFQGANKLVGLLGTEDYKDRPTTYYFISDDGEEPQVREVVRSTSTWYDSRRNQTDRKAEWRLYYPNSVSLVQNFCQDGDLLLLALREDYSLAIFLAPSGSASERTLNQAFGVSQTLEQEPELVLMMNSGNAPTGNATQVDAMEQLYVAFERAGEIEPILAAMCPQMQRTNGFSQRELDLPKGIDETENTDPEGDPEGVISDPFDPTLIRVERSTPTIDLLTRRIQHNEINLAPDFQRKEGIWTDDAKSRLIESILIRIPLPAFYVDATDEDRWLVVDGLQRLTTLKRFVIDKQLELSGLEFLTELNGKKFDDLPRNLQRRIQETEVIVFLIQPGTPPAVKFNIFKRINTGGLPLSPQEIRNAINGNRVRDFIKDLANSPAFKMATSYSIGDKRMADRECVTRFAAFMLTDPAKYSGKDFDNFLNTSMNQIDDSSAISENDLSILGAKFIDAMNRAHRIFGRFAFRKYYGPGFRLSPISKALFECTSRALARLSEEEAAIVTTRKEDVLHAYAILNNDPEFNAAISQGTGDPVRVRRRFARMETLFQSLLIA